jgi:hypothetical protein
MACVIPLPLLIHLALINTIKPPRHLAFFTARHRLFVFPHLALLLAMLHRARHAKRFRIASTPALIEIAPLLLTKAQLIAFNVARLNMKMDVGMLAVLMYYRDGARPGKSFL